MIMNILMKIDKLAKRHLLLSSFLCLMLLALIINLYWTFENHSIDNSQEIGEYIINTVKVSISDTFLFGLIPIFFISFIMHYFLKKKDSVYLILNFYRRLILSLIPSFIIILLFFVWMNVSYYFELSYYNPWSIFIYFVYSIISAAFFSWHSKASKSGIIIKFSIVLLLMGFYYLFVSFLHRSVM